MNDKLPPIEDHDSYIIANALNRLNEVDKENILRIMERLNETSIGCNSIDSCNAISSEDTTKN